MKKRFKKIVCLLISVMLIVGSMPIGVMAEGVSAPETTPVNSSSITGEGLVNQEIEGENPAITMQSTSETPEISQNNANVEPVMGSETLETMETDGDYDFSVNAAGEAVITKYNGSATVLTIPETLISGTQKVMVVEIAAGAFNNCDNLIEVELPSTLTTIQSTLANGAFAECDNLAKITIHPSVKAVGSYCFKNSPKAVIYGEDNSFIEDYASEYEIKFVATALFYVKSFAASLASGQNIKTPITLTALVSGGTGVLEYRYYYDLVDLDGVKTSGFLQDWTTSTTATFTPATAGIYTLWLAVRDTTGKTCLKSIKEFKISNTPVISEFTADKKSPQYIDSSILLSAVLEDGTGKAPFTYAFSYKLGSEKTVLQDFSTASTCPFLTGTAGSYTFYVTVKDSLGKAHTKTIDDYKIVENFAVGSFTIDKVSPQEQGTALNLAAQGVGGKTAYQYRFYYTLDGGVETEIQAYSAKSTAVFTPANDGDYKISVDVKNASGIPVSQSKDFKIVDTPKIGTFTAKTLNDIPFYVGNTDLVTLTADAVTGGTGPFTYAFSYKVGTEAAKTAIPSTPGSNTVNFKPLIAGTYTFYVDVTDSRNLIGTKAISNYVVYDTLAVSLVPDKAAPQNKESMVKITANGSGGKAPYKYQFFYSKPDGTEVEVGPATTTKTASLKLTDPGNYIFGVVITDATGITKEVALPPYLIRDNPVVTDITTNRDTETGHYVNKPVTLTAIVSGGSTATTYNISCKLGTKTVFSQDSTAKTATFTPDLPGTYSITITAQDSDGSTSTYTENYVVLAGVTGKTVSVSKTTGVVVDDIVKLTAMGSGGKAPYTYQFYFKKDSDINFTPIGEAGTVNIISYPISTTGTYTFYVGITDANNELISDKSVTASVPIKVANPPVITAVNLAKTAGQTGTTTVYGGDTLAITPAMKAGKGVGALTYKYDCKLGAKLLWTSGITTEDSVDYQLSQPGSYTFDVTVTDEMGSSVTYKTATVKVLAGVTVKSLSVNKKTDAIVSEEIKLTAVGMGGQAAYQYEYFYNAGSGAIPIGSSTDSKTCSFKPTVPGTYTFSVKITDKNGAVSSNTATETAVVTVINPPVIESLVASPEKGGAIYSGETVSLTAKVKANTGSGPLTYQFYYMQGVKKVPIANTNNTAVFTPPAVGSYTIGVDVTDSATLSDTEKMTGYKVLAGVSVKSLRVDKKSGTNVGNPIKFTAAATGGKAPYSYEFYSIDENAVEKILRPYSSLSTMSFTPDEDGVFTFHVRIKDANDKLCSNDKEVYILDYTIVDYPIINEFKSSVASGQYVNTEILLTANVKGGVKPYSYAFSYKLGRSAAVPITADATNPNTAVFKPSTAGIYTLYVTITDSDESPPVTMAIKSFKVITQPSVKSFTVSKSEMVKGTKVLLRAVATGGQTPYRYQFAYKKTGDTNETVIRAYSTTSSYTFIPVTAGTYTMYVKVTDKHGTMVSLEGDKTITVTE